MPANNIETNVDILKLFSTGEQWLSSLEFCQHYQEKKVI